MIYYEKYGYDSSPVILCLHGANFVQCFAKLYDSLTRRYCLIIPHLPGYGRSSGETFSAELAVEQIAEFAESLGKRVTLMGFSLGAQLCLPLVCSYEQLFNGAVMISPWLIKSPQEIEKVMKTYADNEKMAKNRIKLGIESFVMGLDKDDRKEYEEYSRNVSMNTLLASVDNGLQFEDFPEYDDVKLPMLALCGIKETLDIRKTVRALSQHNPNCAYDMWDGAAHNIPIKFDKRLIKTLDDFMCKI